MLIHKRCDELICIYFAIFVCTIPHFHYYIEMNLYDGILSLFFNVYSLIVVLEKCKCSSGFHLDCIVELLEKTSKYLGLFLTTDS